MSKRGEVSYTAVVACLAGTAAIVGHTTWLRILAAATAIFGVVYLVVLVRRPEELRLLP